MAAVAVLATGVVVEVMVIPGVQAAEVALGIIIPLTLHLPL